MDQLNHARDVKYSLTDPRRLVDALNWRRGGRPQARGAITILCPVHGERTPSCSVSRGPDGTIRVFCFGCGWSGDALRAIAVAHSLSEREDFKEILAIGAEIAGNYGLADEIRGGRRDPERKPVARPEYVETRTFPPQEEVLALIRGSVSVLESTPACELLHSRVLDVELIDDLKLARVIDPRQSLPRWASKKIGQAGPRLSWRQTGHILLLPVYDSNGVIRSVRAWRVIEGDTPKRLPPSGYLAQPLVLANSRARLMLQGRWTPEDVFLVEGEPDFLVACTTFGRDAAVIGINSGSWTVDFAKRINTHTRITIATHGDEAGDKYADNVLASFENLSREKRAIWRMRPGA